jgi:DmsE family decaheme c-type cytochrome
MVGKRLRAVFFLCGILSAGGLAAQDAPGCLDCHTDDAGSPVHTVFDSVHGSLDGGGSAACTTCHGPSEVHDRRGRRASPDVSFGPKWLSDLETRNASCQACHDNGNQLLWVGSEHQQENLACNDCHNSHQQRDSAVSDRQLCLGCHARVRSEMQLPSRHPIAEGKTACTDCHNPHGGSGEADLHQVSVNDNCFSCHQEKRGPHLWEHEPVAEDCAVCHRPHGSVNAGLLTARGPALCQQGKNCLNCHSQIHGSNHPSGARLTR